MSGDFAIRIRHRFDAPVGRLFRAWSDPAQLALWMWGSLGRSARAELDFRVGGALRVETARPDGKTWSLSGTYTDIRQNERIVHTLSWDAPMGYPAANEELRAEFAAHGRGSTIELLHSGVPDAKSAEGHRRGWLDVLETLAAHLEG